MLNQCKWISLLHLSNHVLIVVWLIADGNFYALIIDWITVAVAENIFGGFSTSFRHKLSGKQGPAK